MKTAHSGYCCDCAENCDRGGHPGSEEVEATVDRGGRSKEEGEGGEEGGGEEVGGEDEVQEEGEVDVSSNAS